MNRLDWTRRQALAGGLALAATPALGAGADLKFGMPNGACDAHHHIYDPRFPYAPSPPPKKPAPSDVGGAARNAAPAAPRSNTVADYYAFRKPFGTSRDVIVLPSVYLTNNDPLLFFEGQEGLVNTRSVGVIHPDVTDATLKDLAAVGVCGVRIQFPGFINQDEIVPIAKRIAPLGWHIQFHMPGPLLAQLEPTILSLPTPVVIDHMGHAWSVDQPQYRTVRKLLDTGRGWIKVSGMEMDTKVGAPSYSDTAAVSQAYVRANPDRVVWGTNWPVTRSNQVELLNALADVVTPVQLHRILVENPEALYGFDPMKRPATGS